jgi:hypothetical protein
MFTYSDNTNYNLNLIEISFIRQLFMCLMSVMTPMEFSPAEYSADYSALFRRNIHALSVAVVDTRRVLRARETTARGVYMQHAISLETISSGSILRQQCNIFFVTTKFPLIDVSNCARVHVALRNLSIILLSITTVCFLDNRRLYMLCQKIGKYSVSVFSL